ncbi:hypothetical protein CbuG_1485 [Coxiella burnetii CbuG_Q212]|nr:hypothetical protein CbuG_1485 [Coxiella burnetii CbuG_Q212]
MGKTQKLYQLLHKKDGFVIRAFGVNGKKQRLSRKKSVSLNVKRLGIGKAIF